MADAHRKFQARGREPFAYSNSNTRRYSDGDGYCYSNGNSYRNPRGNSNCDGNRHRYSCSDPNRDCDGNPNPSAELYLVC